MVAIYENLEQALIAATEQSFCVCAENDDAGYCCEACQEAELALWAKHFGLRVGAVSR